MFTLKHEQFKRPEAARAVQSCPCRDLSSRQRLSPELLLAVVVLEGAHAGGSRRWQEEQILGSRDLYSLSVTVPASVQLAARTGRGSVHLVAGLDPSQARLLLLEA